MGDEVLDWCPFDAVASVDGTELEPVRLGYASETSMDLVANLIKVQESVFFQLLSIECPLNHLPGESPRPVSVAIERKDEFLEAVVQVSIGRVPG